MDDRTVKTNFLRQLSLHILDVSLQFPLLQEDCSIDIILCKLYITQKQKNTLTKKLSASYHLF